METTPFIEKKRTELDVEFKKNILGIDSHINLYWNNEDRKDVIYSYLKNEKILEREATPDRSYGWRMNFGYYLKKHHITFGGDGNYQGFGGTKNNFVLPGYFAYPPYDVDDEWDSSQYHGIYVDDTYKINENLSVYLGLRYENYYADQSVDQVIGYNIWGRPIGWKSINVKFRKSVFLPKFGVEVNLNQYVSLYTHIAKAARFPDNPAFYWYYAGYRPEVDPNSNITRKDLTYEDALEYEFGCKTNLFNKIYFDINFFNYSIDNYIRWIFGYAPSRVVYNIDRVKIKGIELNNNIKVIDSLYIFGNLTWQDTKKNGDVLDGSNKLSDELSELPEWKFNAGIKYENKDGIMGKLTVHWVDKRLVPFLNGAAPDGTPVGKPIVLKKLRSFSVVDASLRYPILRNKIKGYVTTGVENLFDKYYEEALDYPAPKRTFYLSFEVKF